MSLEHRQYGFALIFSVDPKGYFFGEVIAHKEDTSNRKLWRHGKILYRVPIK